jgi:hypothetical protein
MWPVQKIFANDCATARGDLWVFASEYEKN